MIRNNTEYIYKKVTAYGDAYKPICLLLMHVKIEPPEYMYDYKLGKPYDLFTFVRLCSGIPLCNMTHIYEYSIP